LNELREVLNELREVLNEFEEVLNAMDRIGIFIIKNVSYNSNEKIHYSIMECGSEMGMDLNEMCINLKNVIDITKITEFATYPDDYGSQRKTIISFKYSGRKCEIGEHFGTQRDYLWINILAIEN
jgi:hypothetical protein